MSEEKPGQSDDDITIPDLPVLLITGHAENVGSLDENADLLLKPFNQGDLIASVHKLLRASLEKTDPEVL